MATPPQRVDLVPGDEHTVSEHSKTPGIGGATTSSDTAISDIAISDTTIVDPVVTALAESFNKCEAFTAPLFKHWPALRMEISYHCGRVRMDIA
jgi:hypothetical protein